jgi:NAD(P)-dependent dehydrogenase (short-subunit alcohol dehydrogenase family)
MTSYTAKPADGAAWVTGASSGIGRALALNLAREGFAVFATARSADDLEALSGEAEKLKGEIIAAPGDVTDAGAMAKIVHRIDGEGAMVSRSPFSMPGFIVPSMAKRSRLRISTRALRSIFPVWSMAWSRQSSG